MSDPVTNVEIEDVLSSIRRLVSNEDRITTPPVSPGPEAEQAREPTRLVLTPSLRVDDGAPADSDDGDDAAQAAPHADDAWDGAALHDDEQDDSDHDDTDHGDTGHDGSGAATAPDIDTADWRDDHPDAAGDDDWQEMQDDPGDLAESGHDDAPLHAAADNRIVDRAGELRARVAELEAAVAGRPDQWEPDGDSTDANAGGPVDPLPWEDFAPDDLARDDVADTAKAEPEAEGLAREPEATVAVEQAPRDDALAAAATDDAGVFDDDDLMDSDDEVLDEDALRDLVAEIIRQELQGALGERITRNVRKLVRREIHRALASQELE